MNSERDRLDDVIDRELVDLVDDGPESGRQFPDDLPRVLVPRCHVCSAPLHVFEDEVYCEYCLSFGLAADGPPC